MSGIGSGVRVVGLGVKVLGGFRGFRGSGFRV